MLPLVLSNTSPAILLGFNPKSISGLKLWFDASDASTITQAGGAVSQWNDKSGNANHATQAVGAAQPTIQAAAQNGRDTLRFTSASSQFLTLASPFSTTSFTAISVKRRGGPAGGSNTVVLFGGSAAMTCYWFTSGEIFIYGNSQYFKTSAVANTDYRQVSVSKASGAADAYVNGAQVSVTGPTALASNDIFQTVGRGFGNYCNGEVAEVLLFDRVLSVAERQRIEVYLKKKWGTP